MHRFAKVAISLQVLGCPTPDNQYNFIDNWDETITHLSNGRRMRIELWPDFKDGDYFKYEERFATAWGNDEWRLLCGQNIVEQRNAAKEQIEASEKVVKDLRAKALSLGVAPTKKRRSC